MGSVHSCCELDSTTLGLEMLRNMFVGGKQIKIRPDPNADVQVVVSILEVFTKDGGSIKWNPAKFTVRDLVFKTSNEVYGNNTELAKAAAAKGSGAVAQTFNISEETKEKLIGTAVGAAGKAFGAASKLLGGKSDTPEETVRTIQAEATIDMTKEYGVEEVDVKVKDVKTDHLAGKLLSVDFIRRTLEKAISTKATEVINRQIKQKTDKALEKIGAK
mmetsp:Transcript_51600/g.81959  ORF Transcript_51600/g.81959 Transcript_51600/m.81959 type:complete len:217 (-) Transcript_51600:141-791(-)